VEMQTGCNSDVTIVVILANTRYLNLPAVVGVPKVCIDKLLFILTLNCKLLVTNDKAQINLQMS